MLWTNHLQEAHAKNWKCMPKLNYAQDRKDHLSIPVTIGKQAVETYGSADHVRKTHIQANIIHMKCTYTYLVWVIVRSCVLFTLPKETVWKVPELVLSISLLPLLRHVRAGTGTFYCRNSSPLFAGFLLEPEGHLSSPGSPLSLVEKAAVHFPLPRAF